MRSLRSRGDEQVRRYLEGGLYENAFARVRCPDCRGEYLLAFSCKMRDLYPSCEAKRSAATAALLDEDVLEEMGHAQWVFVMTKMLRVYSRPPGAVRVAGAHGVGDGKRADASRAGGPGGRRGSRDVHPEAAVQF